MTYIRKTDFGLNLRIPYGKDTLKQSLNKGKVMVVYKTENSIPDQKTKA